MGFTERNGKEVVHFLLGEGFIIQPPPPSMIHHRNRPAVCSLLLLAGSTSLAVAQAPLLPPAARHASLGEIAQAAPAATAPPLVPTAPNTSTTPIQTGTLPNTAPTTNLEPTTPAPTGVDPNVPAPIAPPPIINGVNSTAPGVIPPPATDVAAPGAAANAGGARPREFQGDDVGQVLRLLARQAKISLIVSPQIVGTINMRLEDVTALQAIEVICQAQGYDFTQQNNVYYVKTVAEKAAEPTQADFYTFSYARASQVIPLLTGQLKSKAAPPQVDERTNTVFYQEAKSNVSSIRQFLARVDKPTRQVMIEARLVEVNSNPTQSYGINWAGVVGSSASPKAFRYGGSNFPTLPSTVAAQTVLNPNTAAQTTVPRYDANGAPLQVPSGLTTTTTQTFANGVPVLNDFVRNASQGLNALGSQFAILDIPQFSATLRFLNEDTDSEFLANPRIVTADNLEATIKIVRNQPVPQLNFNEQTATAVFGGFQDKLYGNTLVVKPSINKDNFITLSVKPEISNRVGDQVFNFAGAAVSSPIIDTRTLDANVLIKSGCTLAIGGLLQDQTSKATTKVPILGDIPILGYLFQEHLNQRSKRNLLIFVTPTIISQQFGTGLEDQVTGLKNANSRTDYADPNGWRNNAKGALHLTKPRDRQLTGEYPAPGNCNERVSFKDGAATRD